MKFVIITHVPHIQNENQYFGYGPYINEMNIWLKTFDVAIVVAPLQDTKQTAIDNAYKHNEIIFRQVSKLNFTSVKNSLFSFFNLPLIFWRTFWAMKKADHIHLRCPGNMGLIGCFVQILFPEKIKTAKYAGNWDPESKQPFTYKIQKWILKNTFFTRNMTVLVYGHWENQSKNIKPFFTATYLESERVPIRKTDLNSLLKFIFVGSLVLGKNPLYAVKLIQRLRDNGYKAVLDLYGEGIEKESLKKYIKINNLENFIILHGNQNRHTLKEAYQKSHFVILPSKSEGWPKAIAEGMFWGCIPIASKVSCVPFMLDYGSRGILLEMNLDQDIKQIEKFIKTENGFATKSRLSANWSQNYTVDVFEAEIQKLLTT
ncbi:glycosyl transferase [Flavobacterium collinsii]|uniref:glycosyltransferase n=1 Tax=Flavobacterium collinsii TaxID=1114861 RepID=UPI0022C803DA|nr:glycosyltransferase [Flavobacterium collinsii]GIQ58545.1 glycosyl transferase [Flavobacterium collinsii]